jgi:hypothetical protein
MTHPLTDKILDKFGTDDQQFAFELATKWEPTRIYLDDDMRSAADWQLEQVIEWLKFNTDDYLLEDYYKTYFLTEDFLDDFKKAMRPTTTTQEDN